MGFLWDHVQTSGRRSTGSTGSTSEARSTARSRHPCHLACTWGGICRPSRARATGRAEPARWNTPSISGHPNTASLTRPGGTALMSLPPRPCVTASRNDGASGGWISAGDASGTSGAPGWRLVGWVGAMCVCAPSPRLPRPRFHTFELTFRSGLSACACHVCPL